MLPESNENLSVQSIFNAPFIFMSYFSWLPQRYRGSTLLFFKSMYAYLLLDAMKDMIVNII